MKPLNIKKLMMRFPCDFRDARNIANVCLTCSEDEVGMLPPKTPIEDLGDGDIYGGKNEWEPEDVNHFQTQCWICPKCLDDHGRDAKCSVTIGEEQ